MIRPMNRPRPGLERMNKASGFPLAAAVRCAENQNDKRVRYCLHGRPGQNRPELGSSSQERTGYPYRPVARATIAGAARYIAFFVQASIYRPFPSI